jgi:alpha-L-fucosidase
LANATNAEVEKSVKLVAKTAAPDGMIFDENGTLYFADLENNKIMYRKQDGSIHTLVEGEKSDGLTRLVSITTTCISPTLELMKLQPIFQI